MQATTCSRLSPEPSIFEDYHATLARTLPPITQRRIQSRFRVIRRLHLIGRFGDPTSRGLKSRFPCGFTAFALLSKPLSTRGF